MAEVESQASSAATVDYMEMGSEGFEMDRKRERDKDGDEEKPDKIKKQKTSDDDDDDDDWMNDRDLFTKVRRMN